MFLKHLIITNRDGLIRRVDFRMGMNLIIDETPGKTSVTGNNVGKTTLLKLIDYCLGADAPDVYTSSEGSVNQDVKKFLKDTEVCVELCLVESFVNPHSRKVVIRRDFRGGRKGLYEINGKRVEKDKKKLERALSYALWDMDIVEPTFREIISHNFRINDLRITQTLRTIHQYQPDVVYEALHMFMFGANTDDAEEKVRLTTEIKSERTHKPRLEKNASLSALRGQLAIVERRIAELEQQRSTMDLNPDFESDLDRLTLVKNQLGKLAKEQNNLMLRKQLIQDAEREMQKMVSNANSRQIEEIYRQASAFNSKMHHTFEELLTFHNEMLSRRAKFVTAELPSIEEKVDESRAKIGALLAEERELEDKLNFSATCETYNEMITQLNQCHDEHGKLTQSIEMIEEVERNILANETKLKEIDEGLFSEARQNIVQDQINKFNMFFSGVSQKLYGEDYAIEYIIKNSPDGKPCYKFRTFAEDNFSTGKKQGEIACFDLAYISFADSENIPCLHFVLNDKKELVHGNQLALTASAVEEQGNVQYVASILRDKLPTELNEERYFVQKLSMDDRLFKF